MKIFFEVRHDRHSCQNVFSFLEFSGLFYCSIIKVHSSSKLVSHRCLTFAVNFFSLTHTVYYVNHFLKLYFIFTGCNLSLCGCSSTVDFYFTFWTAKSQAEKTTFFCFFSGYYLDANISRFLLDKKTHPTICTQSQKKNPPILTGRFL